MHENRRVSDFGELSRAAHRGWIGEKKDLFSALLNARVPLIPLIVLPIPALPTSGPGQGLYQFDHHHILGLFVAKLLFKAQSNRRAMGDVQRGVV